MVESPLLSAICRASHVSRQDSESFPLQSHGYQMLPTLTVSVVCQSPPSAHSCTLHLPPPHHMLPFHTRTFLLPPQPGLLRDTGQPAPSTCFDWPRTSSWWGLRMQLSAQGMGGVESAYQGLEILAIGRGRETLFSELAKVKFIQIPRGWEQCWRTCKFCMLLTAGYIW